jgi:hypothetical protein
MSQDRTYEVPGSFANASQKQNLANKADSKCGKVVGIGIGKVLVMWNVALLWAWRPQQGSSCAQQHSQEGRTEMLMLLASR